jgi:hypothetical protein
VWRNGKKPVTNSRQQPAGSSKQQTLGSNSDHFTRQSTPDTALVQRKLFDDYRYFFCLITDRETTIEEILFTASARCDQENQIAQLKSQRALHAPLNTLNAN